MENGEIIYIPVEHIHPHPENPRKDLGDLSELADSIVKNGVMQNLTVIPMEGKEGEYVTLIGHRRCAAAKLAGIDKLPCRVVEGMGRKEQLSVMLEENIQRNDLTIMEQVQGFQMMLDLGETEETLAEKTGFSRTTIRHRLNIAKLDREELEKKEHDEGFQLTLRDLYELEKIENVKTRNMFLKKAGNSRELVAMVQTHVENGLRIKRIGELESIMENEGIRKAPKGAENEQYTGKWEVLLEINLDNDVPKELHPKDPGPDPMYYLVYFNEFRIIKKARKVKRELTPEEIAQKELDNRKKEIKDRIKKMDADRETFIRCIVSGKIDPVKDEDAIREKAWRCMLETGVYVCVNGLTGFFLRKHEYDCSDEEVDAARKQVDALGSTESMLVMLNRVSDYAGSIVDYYGHYNEQVGRALIHCYEVLKPYGWTFADEDDEKILDGTHELYAKEDDNGNVG